MIARVFDDLLLDTGGSGRTLVNGRNLESSTMVDEGEEKNDLRESLAFL